MDLGFTDTIELSTNDLPYLACNPPLIFEFNLATTFEFNTRLHVWSVYQDLAEGGEAQLDNDEFKDVSIEIAQRKASDLLKGLAAVLLLKVIRQDGVEFELGNREAIESLVSSTGPEFLVNLMKSWLLRLAIEREENKKKQAKSYNHSPVNVGKKTQARD